MTIAVVILCKETFASTCCLFFQSIILSYFFLFTSLFLYFHKRHPYIHYFIDNIILLMLMCHCLLQLNPLLAVVGPVGAGKVTILYSALNTTIKMPQNITTAARQWYVGVTANQDGGYQCVRNEFSHVSLLL